MAKRIVKEDELFHQGRTLSQWVKAFNGEFTAEQLTRMIKGGCDLEKMLMLGLDEDDDECDGKHCSKRLDEVSDPENVITVKDFLEIIAKRVSKYDTVFFKSGKTMLELIDIHAKGGVTVLDFIKSKPGANVSNLDIYTVEDLVRCIKRLPFDMNNKVMFRDMGPKTELSFFDLYTKRGVAIFEFAFGKAYDLDEDEECCCRAKDLKWHAVKDVCPDCASKMSDDWRCGPAAKKFCDLLYPNRKYKPGTLVMRNRAVKAGAESGEKIIAVPSYFYAIQTNDVDALNLLEALGISLDLAF